MVRAAVPVLTLPFVKGGRLFADLRSSPIDAEALLRMIFGLSTNFISLPPDDVDDGINDVLKAIGTFARVDRSGVFQFSENGDKVGRTHEWSANGVASRLEYVSAESLSWLCGRIRSCEVVHIPDVWKLPAEAAQERDEFLAHRPSIDCRRPDSIRLFRHGLYRVRKSPRRQGRGPRTSFPC